MTVKLPAMMAVSATDGRHEGGGGQKSPPFIILDRAPSLIFVCAKLRNFFLRGNHEGTQGEARCA